MGNDNTQPFLTLDSKQDSNSMRTCMLLVALVTCIVFGVLNFTWPVASEIVTTAAPISDRDQDLSQNLRGYQSHDITHSSYDSYGSYPHPTAAPTPQDSLDDNDKYIMRAFIVISFLSIGKCLYEASKDEHTDFTCAMVIGFVVCGFLIWGFVECV